MIYYTDCSFKKENLFERLDGQLDQLFLPMDAELTAHQRLMEGYRTCSQHLTFVRRCLNVFDKRMESDPSSLSGDWTYMITIPNRGFTPRNGVQGDFDREVKSMVAEIRGTFRMIGLIFHLERMHFNIPVMIGPISMDMNSG